MTVSIEQHGDWVADTLADLQRRAASTRSSRRSRPRRAGCSTSTTAPTSRSTRRRTRGTWAPTCRASRGCSCPTSAASTRTATICDEVVANDYLGFQLSGRAGAQCNDGVVRRLQPDVAMVLEHDGRRSTCRRSRRCRPPTPARSWRLGAHAPARPRRRRGRRRRACPAPTATCDYRLYRPATLGSASDRRLLPRRRMGVGQPGVRRSVLPRSLRARPARSSSRSTTDMRPSTSSRPPPTTPSPLCAGSPTTPIELGGIPGQLAVAGWSAGGNVAAVAARRRSDAGGPEIVGQLLMNPVTDSDMTTAVVPGERRGLRPHEGADGVVLGPLHGRCRSHRPVGGAVASGGPLGPPAGGDRHERVRPAARRGRRLRAGLEGCRGRDEHVFARGHTHTSLTMVGMVLSGAPVRAEMGDALRGFFKASVPA